MRRGLHVFVAVHAGEHAAVDGSVLFAGVDGRIGVGSVRGWHCVGVAGEAFGILGFRLGGNSSCESKQGSNSAQRADFPRESHAQSTRRTARACGDSGHR